MNDIEVSSIDLVEGGNVFKQGHYLTLGYVPRDEKGETVDLSGKTLNVALWGRKGVVFEAGATYSGGVIRFTLDKMVPAGDYTVEFTVTSSTDAKYRKKFPTNQHSGRIAIKQSADDLGVVGIQVYTVAQLKAEQKAIQAQYESTVDAKVQASDAKSTTALTKSTAAEATANDVKSQFEQVVISGDSSVEAAAARVAPDQTFVSLKARLDAKEQATALQLAEETKFISDTLNQSVATNNISNGGGYIRKPVAAITFDDGYMNDFNLMKPVMDEFGVKGSIYINTQPQGSDPRITAKEIKQLATEGWEFGSHTRSHSNLSYLALSKSIAVGDTNIQILNNTSAPQIIAYPTGTKIRVENSDIVFTVVSGVLSNGVLTLQLEKPATYAVATPRQIYLHEESVLAEILAPKAYLKSLGVPCTGIAYPYGFITESAKKVVQSNFAYGRNASGTNAGTNGGVLDGDDIPLKQFTLNCSELPNLTSGEMDSLIAQVKTENGLLIVLGHTNGWSALEPKLRTMLTKLQAAGVEIMPLNKALLYHGNVTELGDFRISKEGKIANGGLNIISKKGFTAATGAKDFPVGHTLIRFFGGTTSHSFPTGAGLLQNLKTRTTGDAYNTVQIWTELSTSAINRVYYRIATGSYAWGAWTSFSTKGAKYERLSTGMQTVPANGKVDIAVPEVIVTNYSTPIITAGALHDFIRFTPFISGAVLYIRLENLSASPVSWEQRFNVTVNDSI